MALGPKRERWTEADVIALPSGEPDLFDRKGGGVFADTAKLKGTLAKALSAFANSGGGHLLLGVADDGSFDGVPLTHGKGNTPTREWLEQVIPNLTAYPLSDFRVHDVEREPVGSAIPSGRTVIVIDVGDSALAPHQCAYDGPNAQSGIYYHRQGGHSVAAGHFYLELLRQRVTNPALEVTFGPARRWFSEAPVTGGLFIAFDLPFTVENVGRVAAYKWAVQAILERGTDVELYWEHEDWPVPKRGRSSGIVLDQTLLPGASTTDHRTFGVVLRESDDARQAELEGIVDGVTLRYRVATESLLTDYSEVALADLVGVDLIRAS